MLCFNIKIHRIIDFQFYNTIGTEFNSPICVCMCLYIIISIIATSLSAKVCQFPNCIVHKVETGNKSDNRHY